MEIKMKSNDFVISHTYYSEDVDVKTLGFEISPVLNSDVENIVIIDNKRAICTDDGNNLRKHATALSNNTTTFINYSHETDEFEVNLIDNITDEDDNAQSDTSITDTEEISQCNEVLSIPIDYKSSLRPKKEYQDSNNVSNKKVMFKDQMKSNNDIDGEDRNENGPFKAFDSLLQNEAIEIAKSRSFSKTAINENSASSFKERTFNAIEESSQERGDNECEERTSPSRIRIDNNSNKIFIEKRTILPPPLSSVQISNNNNHSDNDENNSLNSRSNSIETSLLTSEGGGSSTSPELVKNRTKRNSMFRKTKNMFSFKKNKNNSSSRSSNNNLPPIPFSSNNSNCSVLSSSSSSCDKNGINIGVNYIVNENNNSRNNSSDTDNKKNGDKHKENNNNVKDEFDSYLAEVAVHAACMVLEKGGGDIVTAQDSALSILLKGMKNYRRGVYIGNNSNKKKHKQQKKKMIEDDTLQAASIAVTALSTNISNKQVVDLVINTFNMQGYKCSPYHSRDITTCKKINISNTSVSSSTTSSRTRVKEQLEHNPEKDVKDDDDQNKDTNNRTTFPISNEEERHDTKQGKKKKIFDCNNDKTDTTISSTYIKNDIDIQKDRMKRLMSISKSSSSLSSEERLTRDNRNDKYNDISTSDRHESVSHQISTKQPQHDNVETESMMRLSSTEMKDSHKNETTLVASSSFNSNELMGNNKAQKAKQQLFHTSKGNKKVIDIPSLMSITSADNSDTEYENENDSDNKKPAEGNDNHILLKHRVIADSEKAISSERYKKESSFEVINNGQLVSSTQEPNDSIKKKMKNKGKEKKVIVSSPKKKQNNNNVVLAENKDNNIANDYDEVILNNIPESNNDMINNNTNNNGSSLMFCVSASSILPTCQGSSSNLNDNSSKENNSSIDKREQQVPVIGNDNDNNQYVKAKRFRNKKKKMKKFRNNNNNNEADDPEMFKKERYYEKEKKKEAKIRQVIREINNNNNNNNSVEKKFNTIQSFDSETEQKVQKVLHAIKIYEMHKKI